MSWRQWLAKRFTQVAYEGIMEKPSLPAISNAPCMNLLTFQIPSQCLLFFLPYTSLSYKAQEKTSSTAENVRVTI